MDKFDLKKYNYATEEYKNTIVELYNSGKTLAELNSEYGLPKSTIFLLLSFLLCLPALG